MKKLLILAITLTTIFSVNACKKKPAEILPDQERVTLTYYKLYENEENMQPFFNEFSKKYPYVTINYKKFVDPEKYLDTIVNEIAEGGGPDIISVPNTWVLQNLKKLTPAPSDIVATDAYRDTLVDIAATDNIFKTQDGTEQVYGMPLTVDSLAIYYNDQHFESRIPERGKPSTTWSGLVNDALILTDYNSNNTDLITRSGLALGRGNNLLRITDVFYTLMLQNQISLYDSDFKNAKFASNTKTLDVVNFIKSFADPASPNYTWNDQIISPETREKEIKAFVTGQTSMIFGYSHLYQDLLDQIEIQKNLGLETIKPSDVRISEIPQQSLNEDVKIAYASYFTEAVSRNTEHPEEAWLLLTEMIQKQNLESWYKKDFKPSVRRDLIPEQRQNPIFSPFINQIGYARSMPIIDQIKYNEIFKTMFEEALTQENIRPAVVNAENLINQLIPNEGAYPLP